MVFSELDNKNIYTSWTCRVEDCAVNRTPASSLRPRGARTIAIDPDEEFELSEPTQPCYYTLSFTHTFKYDNDKVYFAFCKPYSYTRLKLFYNKIETELFKDAVNAKCENVNMLPEVQIETKDLYYKRIQLATSAGGVPVDAITISSASPALQPGKRGYVVITARVHASETPGSYKVQGILKFLLSKDKVAAALRQDHVFLVVPMLNPDGVILGNSRYSIEGYDLNRCWGSPSCYKHPAIYSLKETLRKLTAAGQKLFVYCDMHGHSKLYNSFIYACHKVSAATFSSWTKTRLLPRILAKKCHLFDYHQCSFKVENEKLNTARVIVWKEFKVTNSFTLESSMYAYTMGTEVTRFTEREYSQIGEALMLALYEYQLIIGQLQKEMGVNKGWLKPGRLAELAGTPAADLLRQEIEEANEDAKKKERRDKGKAERVEKVEKTEKIIMKTDKVEKMDKIEKTDKVEKVEKPERLGIRLQMCKMQSINKVEFICNPPPPSVNGNAGSRAASCLAKYRTFETGSVLGKKPRVDTTKGFHRKQNPTAVQDCVKIEPEVQRGFSLKRVEKPERLDSILHPYLSHNNFDPSWEEYFTETELEEIMNTITRKELKPLEKEIAELSQEQTISEHPSFMGHHDSKNFPEEGDLKQVRKLQKQRNTQGFSRRKPRSVADPDILEPCFLNCVPRIPELEVEQVQIQKVALQPKVMKIAMARNTPHWSANKREPISLSKRFVYESKASFHKKQMNSTGVQGKVLKGFDKTPKMLGAAATRTTDIRRNDSDKLGCEDDCGSEKKGVLFNPTAKLLNRSNNSDAEGVGVMTPMKPASKYKRRSKGNFFVTRSCVQEGAAGWSGTMFTILWIDSWKE